MDLSKFTLGTLEKPLDRIIDDGGYTSIFRKIGCIGDSLSSGEFESEIDGVKGWNDMYDYSWGQYLARAAGTTVINMSRGGMTAREYYCSFADANGFWNEENICEAYIIALGVNDMNRDYFKLGTVDDIDIENYENNPDTFAGDYGRIIGRLKKLQPKARFFLVTMPRNGDVEANLTKMGPLSKLLNEIAAKLDKTYCIDLFTYGPVYNYDFRQQFFLGSHLNPMGYMMTAKMIGSYIDYTVRANMEDFFQVGFIGKDLYFRDPNA